MTEYIPGEILSKRALDRWENEGGRTCLDSVEMNTGSMSHVETAQHRVPAATRSVKDEVYRNHVRDGVYEH